MRCLADAVTTLQRNPGWHLVAGAQMGMETFSLFMAEFGLAKAPKAMPEGVTVVVNKALQAWMKEKKEKARGRNMTGRRAAPARETNPRQRGSS